MKAQGKERVRAPFLNFLGEVMKLEVRIWGLPQEVKAVKEKIQACLDIDSASGLCEDRVGKRVRVYMTVRPGQTSDQKETFQRAYEKSKKENLI